MRNGGGSESWRRKEFGQVKSTIQRSSPCVNANRTYQQDRLLIVDQVSRGGRGVNRRTADWTAGHIFSDGASSTSTARFHRCYGESCAGWAYQ